MSIELINDTDATDTDKPVTHGQIKGLRWAARGLGLDLVFPEAEVTEGDTMEADLIVSGWYPNGHESQDKMASAIAERVSIARIMTEDGWTMQEASEAIDFAKKADVTPEAKTDFLALVEMEANVWKPQEKKGRKTSARGKGKAKKQTASFVMPPSLGHTMAVPAQPGTVSPAAVALAADLAARGLGAEAIAAALGGMRAVGLL